MAKADKERVKALLTEAVTLLCRNSLAYNSELEVEGLLGITLDKSEVMLVSIRETVMSANSQVQQMQSSAPQFEETYSVQKAKKRASEQFPLIAESEPVVLDDDSEDGTDFSGEPPSKKIHEDGQNSDSNFNTEDSQNADRLQSEREEVIPVKLEPSAVLGMDRNSVDDGDGGGGEPMDKKPDLSLLAQQMPGFSGWADQSGSMFGQNMPSHTISSADNSSMSQLSFKSEPSAALPFSPVHQSPHPSPHRSSMSYPRGRGGGGSRGQKSTLGRKQQNSKHLSPAKIMRNPSGKLDVSELMKETQKTIISKTVFYCPVCNTPFTEKGNLRRHIKGQHEGQREWRCGRCDKYFAQKPNLKTHLRNTHGVEEEHMLQSLCVYEPPSGQSKEPSYQ